MWCSKTGSLWRKTQRERRREREEREGGLDGETEREKREGEEGGGFFSRLESGRHIN